jgi:hypothetical protein
VREVERRVLDGNRRRQLAVRDEARGERVPRRPLEAVRACRERLGKEEGPDARVREQRVDEQPHRDEREGDIREEQEPPPVDRVRDRARVERHRQDRNEPGDRQQPDDERRVCQLVDLKRDRDRRDLTADRRDAGSEPEPAEVLRRPERRQVDREAGQPAGVRRPVALGYAAHRGKRAGRSPALVSSTRSAMGRAVRAVALRVPARISPAAG